MQSKKIRFLFLASVSVLTLFVLTLLLTGCAEMASRTSTQVVTFNLDPATGRTNSIVVDRGRTSMGGFAVLDANQALQKARNQSGYSHSGTNTFAPGSTLGGLNQSSTSTNLVQMFKILEAMAAAGAL
ncbi:MAG TPA: hypothetical protein VMU04_10100 [Candidatus Acidoferrum sp.]|nr:hypothetical protein [Candidatus Acidoferrum sp.]